MTNEQLYLAIGVPLIGNFLILTIGFGLLSARFSDLRADMDPRFSDLRAGLDQRFADLRAGIDQRFAELRAGLDHRFTAIDQRFAEVDRRFVDMEKMWRDGLRRVEEVLDARLKHLEERP